MYELEGLGRFDGNCGVWKWNTFRVAELSTEELYEIYEKCRKSWVIN